MYFSVYQHFEYHTQLSFEPEKNVITFGPRIVGNKSCAQNEHENKQALFKHYSNISRCIRKQSICICETNGADQTAQLISTFDFATLVVQFLLYLNPKLPDSSFLLWVYRPVYVGPGRKSQRPVFTCGGSNKQASSRHGSNIAHYIILNSENQGPVVQTSLA